MKPGSPLVRCVWNLMKRIRRKLPKNGGIEMTIREAGKGIVTNRKRICSYRIGFINSDGREDEQNWMCVIC